MSETATCKLCGESKELCKAHLLPNSLRRVVVDFPADKSMQAVHMDQKRDYPVQTLRYDPNILCAKCDASLGPFDKDFASILKSWVELPARRQTFWRWGIETYCSLEGTPEHLFHVRFSYSERHPEINLGLASEQTVIKTLEKRLSIESRSPLIDVRLVRVRWQRCRRDPYDAKRPNALRPRFRPDLPVRNVWAVHFLEA